MRNYIVGEVATSVVKVSNAQLELGHNKSIGDTSGDQANFVICIVYFYVCFR